jgi:hypothetical protein
VARMRWNGKATGVLNNVVIRNYLDYTAETYWNSKI